jgi:hypothetical protein
VISSKKKKFYVFFLQKTLFLKLRKNKKNFFFFFGRDCGTPAISTLSTKQTISTKQWVGLNYGHFSQAKIPLGDQRKIEEYHKNPLGE